MLLNQVHTPECSKASLLTQVGVKESAALIVKAPIRGGQVARALNPELSQRFQQSSCTGHMREVIRVCDPLVHSSLVGQVRVS